MHEQLTSHGEVKKSSERTFGLVFAAFLAIISFVPLLHHGHIRIWSLVLAAGVITI